MSTIKVNTIENRTGSTLTLGKSGTTIQMACGATQTGFGRSGSVNWQTTPKTTTFTAVNGEGYFINSGSSITANLPAGSAGAIVAFSDYARNFATYPFTIAPNGSEKIGGVAETLQLDVNGQAITLVYVDSTKGWINVQNAEDTEIGVSAAYVAASGGCVATVGDFKIHTFNSDADFIISDGGNSKGNNKIEYLVVAGGGAGGGDYQYTSGGGGGAGGYRFSNGTSAGSYCAGPAPLGATAITGLSAATYPISVGAGGATAPAGTRNPGSNSIFSTIISAGGGGGGSKTHPGPFTNTSGADGGSGGGAHPGARDNPAGASPGFGSGNTPPVSPPQGNNGGANMYPLPGAPYYGGGGGGGASAVGTNGTPTQGGPGGAGLASSITNAAVS